MSSDELNKFLPAILEGQGVLHLLCHHLAPREENMMRSSVGRHLSYLAHTISLQRLVASFEMSRGKGGKILAAEVTQETLQCTRSSVPAASRQLHKQQSDCWENCDDPAPEAVPFPSLPSAPAHPTSAAVGTPACGPGGPGDPASPFFPAGP